MSVQRVQTAAGEQQLRELLEAHAELAESSKAQSLLDNWKDSLGKFWQLVPPSESGTPEASKDAEGLMGQDSDVKDVKQTAGAAA